MRIEKESWRIIELIIRRYPYKKKEYESYISDIMSSSVGSFRGNETGDRPQSVTEAKAMKMHSAYYDRIKKQIEAVEFVYNGLNPEEQKIMRKRYWTDRERNIPYTKLKEVSYSERQMKRIVYRIIVQVGKYLGEIK
jgi:hypothetical protein